MINNTKQFRGKSTFLFVDEIITHNEDYIQFSIKFNFENESFKAIVSGENGVSRSFKTYAEAKAFLQQEYNKVKQKNLPPKG